MPDPAPTNAGRDSQPEDLAPYMATNPPWLRAFLWAIPMCLWVLAAGGTGVGFFVQVSSGWSTHQDRQATINTWRQQGEVEAADGQTEIQHRDDWQAVERATALAVGFAASLAIAALYRKKVPLARRGGVRALVLVVLLLAALGALGFVLLGFAMRGAITG